MNQILLPTCYLLAQLLQPASTVTKPGPATMAVEAARQSPDRPTSTASAPGLTPSVATDGTEFARLAAMVQMSVRVKNESQVPIIVVMDTERQVHSIGAGAAATFHPNVGDNPTYHVYESTATGGRGRHLWSESFNTLHLGSPDLKWTGSRLERD